MKNSPASISYILDLVLSLFELKEIPPIAVVVYLYLYNLAGSAGYGHVTNYELSCVFGCDEDICSAYLRLLTRNGLLEALYPDDCDGAVFKLALSSTTATSPPG